jgi:CDP-diacylglycerol--serine O-phosphatidyltransferase
MPVSTQLRDAGLPRAPWRFFHLSNLLTYLLVFAAIVAVAGARSGRLWQAGCAIAAASLLDLFDGAFAGRFSRTEARKRFGVQIDSLSDAIAFGAAPVVVGLLQLAGSVPLWWIAAAVFYLLCALTRLGYYNLQTDERGGFVGVPTTLMGLMWSVLWSFALPAAASATAMVLGGAAMVAPLRIARPKPPLFFAVAALSALLAGWHISNGLFSQPH